MGLMNKLKSILFEEEEVEIPVIEKKEPEVKENKELPKKEEPKKEVFKGTFYEEEEKIEEPKREVKESIVSEIETFKSEKTFNFPAFDEEEFESVIPPKRPTNVLEYEKKKVDRRNDYVRYDKKEVRVEEKPKFKPSPIISPVYGILDKNYTPDEITTRENPTPKTTIDVDSVRKKAFGSLDDKETGRMTIKEEEEKIMEEKLEKARTIDELLKDSSDEVIELNKVREELPEVIDDEIVEDVKEEVEPTLKDIDEVIDESLSDSIDSLDEKEETSTADVEDDTIESDLFDLIDSMYDNREDGE